MKLKGRVSPPEPRWAYAYRIARPGSSPPLETIELLLDSAHATALQQKRIWTGRIVVEREITHLLIVADSPSQRRKINRRLAEELNDMGAEFSVTPSQAFANEAPQAG